MGQDVRAWPMLVLLLLVVVGAIACVLWFMREAMRNERLAGRQKLADAYRGQLALLQKRVENEWQRGLARFDEHTASPALFAHAVRERWADSVVCFDGVGRVVYPQLNAPTRSAEANAELLALESEPQNQELAERLRRRVNDYDSDALPAAQRRFLMRELQRLAPGGELPTIDAEELAARYLETHPVPVLHETFQTTDIPGVWAAGSPARHALALFTTARLRQEIEKFVRDPTLAAEIRVAAIAPGEDALSDAAFVTNSLAPLLPGWRLALSLDDRALFDSAADKRVTTYLWIGGAVIAAMSVLAVFIARGFGRQVRLARLKNDLVATVSHELKTPLTAMRALVETLLDAEKFDEKTTREYLQMLARENARLSRLIDNFLTFSRLERNKFRFKFAPLQPHAIVESAVAAMGERCEAPACHFEAHVAKDLPTITGDFDALVTALLNLLDNAWKYSGEDKRILLRTEAANGSVRFAVEDKGIGLTPRESRRIFRRFYQADDKLSRDAGGCGLGLSIVQSIVEAHRGSVRVASEAGRGSTFTIDIPAAS